MEKKYYPSLKLSSSLLLSLLAITPTLTVGYGHRVSGGCHACHACHDMVTDVMMLTARRSHLYWGQAGPCRAHCSGPETEREPQPQQSRGVCGARCADLHSKLHGLLFQKQEQNIHQHRWDDRKCLHLVEMNQADDAWSLRILAWAGMKAQWAPPPDQASHGPARCSCVTGPSVATTLHTDTAA